MRSFLGIFTEVRPMAVIKYEGGRAVKIKSLILVFKNETLNCDVHFQCDFHKGSFDNYDSQAYPASLGEVLIRGAVPQKAGFQFRTNYFPSEIKLLEEINKVNRSYAPLKLAKLIPVKELLEEKFIAAISNLPTELEGLFRCVFGDY